MLSVVSVRPSLTRLNDRPNPSRDSSTCLTFRSNFALGWKWRLVTHTTCTFVTSSHPRHSGGLFMGASWKGNFVSCASIAEMYADFSRPRGHHLFIQPLFLQRCFLSHCLHVFKCLCFNCRRCSKPVSTHCLLLTRPQSCHHYDECCCFCNNGIFRLSWCC